MVMKIGKRDRMNYMNLPMNMIYYGQLNYVVILFMLNFLNN
jgi:hypothetical protein